MSREFFPPVEKDTILELVKENKEVIECKKNDMLNNMRKKKVWDKIVESFNQQYSKNITSKQLNANYRRWKMEARKEVSAKRKDLKATGGGPSTTGSAGVLSDTTNSILEINEDLNYTFPNQFDDDHIAENTDDSIATIQLENTGASPMVAANKKPKTTRYSNKENSITKEHDLRIEVLELQKRVYEKQLEVHDKTMEAETRRSNYYQWLMCSNKVNYYDQSYSGYVPNYYTSGQPPQ